MALRSTREEGIFAGGSSGAAVVGALELAKKSDDLSCVVVILPDTGRGYLSKFYNEDWLGSKGL